MFDHLQNKRVTKRIHIWFLNGLDCHITSQQEIKKKKNNRICLVNVNVNKCACLSKEKFRR